MYVCMYLCMYMYVCMYVYMYVCLLYPHTDVPIPSALYAPVFAPGRRSPH